MDVSWTATDHGRSTVYETTNEEGRTDLVVARPAIGYFLWIADLGGPTPRFDLATDLVTAQALATSS